MRPRPFSPRRATFRPGCEALERRDVPAASFNPGTGVITIDGTNLADRVEIQDQGNLGADPRVKVFFNGQLQVDADANLVNSIQLKMRNGNDSVKYDLLDTLASGDPGSTRNVRGT